VHQLGSLARDMMRLQDRSKRPLFAEDPTRTFDKPKFKQPEAKFLYPDELRAFASKRRSARTSARGWPGSSCSIQCAACPRQRRRGRPHRPDGAGHYLLHVRVKGGAHKGFPVSPDIFGALAQRLHSRGKWYVLVLAGLLAAGRALDLLGDALIAWAAR
jgi:hypothetical protein